MWIKDSYKNEHLIYNHVLKIIEYPIFTQFCTIYIQLCLDKMILCFLSFDNLQVLVCIYVRMSYCHILELHINRYCHPRLYAFIEINIKVFL